MTAWLLTDAHAGNVRQTQALAQALAWQATDFTVRLRGLNHLLAPRWKQARWQDLAITPTPPENLPRFAIGCGRTGAVALLALKLANPQVRCIQILDPRVDPNRLDAVICPLHDNLQGPNVIQTAGSLHQITPELLAQCRSEPASIEWPDAENLLLIGAPTRHAPFNQRQLVALLKQISGPINVSASRRTPTELVNAIRAAGHRCFVPTPNAANPYWHWLAHARRIIVTPDSVNMLSEACATTALVHVPWMAQTGGKIQRCLMHFQKRLSALDQAISEQTPWLPMSDVVAKLKLLGLT